MSGYIEFADLQRKARLPIGIEERISEAFETVLEQQRVMSDAEISVTFVSNRRIREINKEFRSIDKSTDVLSFPLGEDGVYDTDPETGRIMLGDVVISLEQALLQAEEYGHSAEREIVYLSVHSMLHLLGYDHMEPDEAAEMRKNEESIMTAIGLER